jgi:hypothetical protein
VVVIVPLGDAHLFKEFSQADIGEWRVDKIVSMESAHLFQELSQAVIAE